MIAGTRVDGLRLAMLAAASGMTASCGLIWDLPDRDLDDRVDCSQGGCACVAGFGDCDGDHENGCETDLRDGPANCGACGHGCQGGECLDGRCQPVEIAAATFVSRLALDATHLYWATASTVSYATGTPVFEPPQTNVSRVPRSGGPVEVVATFDGGRLPTGLVVTGGSCYWADDGPYWNEPATVVAWAVDGAPPRAIGTYPTRIDALAANESHVYFTAIEATSYLGDSRFSVGRMPIAGGPVEVVAPNLAAGIMPTIALDDARAYWFELGLGPQGRIVTMPLDGGAPSAVADTHALAMALGEGWLYWLSGPLAAQETNRVFAMPVAGGQPAVLATEVATVSQIGQSGDFVYFTENGTDQASIMRLPKRGGAVVEVARSQMSGAVNVVVDGTAIFWATGDRIMKLAL